ncbi:hypothetical protein BU16DRAFT_530716 [Lophium mytilinum]|uniref:Uncharacterized protein n=1 Tax=Lophium mytilinum TaxID=390894 RepID=A0A6A6QGF3_9PEZI|nr:hypothetical protein BU16DRAFT_530716 [Lophium mytilinum]
MPFSLDGSLSEELIDRIVQFVPLRPEPWLRYEPRSPKPESPKFSGLAALCLTNKKISRIATPHLYSDIFLEYIEFGVGLRHLLPLTLHMWQSPSHAALVRSFSIRGSWDEKAAAPAPFLDRDKPEYKDHRINWPEHGDLHSIIRARVAEYAKDDEEATAWFEDVKNGRDEGAVLALLLAGLPKLRKLDLSPDYSDPNSYMLRIFQRLSLHKNRLHTSPGSDHPNCPTPFASLTDVFMAGEDDKYPNQPDFFFGALALPALRHLYTYRVGVEGQDAVHDILAAIPPESSPVEFIEVRASKIYSPDLLRVLRIATPGSLKTFMYEIGCSWAWTPVQHEKILAALGPHAPHLTALALSHEDYYPYQDTQDHDEETPCALQFTHFTALRQLKFAPVFVWGHDGLFSPPPEGTQGAAVTDYRAKLWRALPPALEELWITHVRDLGALGYGEQITGFVTRHLFTALEEVLVMKARCFPGLTRLKLEGKIAVLEKWGVDIVAFMRLADGYGVQVTLISTAGDVPYKGESEEMRWGWDEDVRWNECINNQGPPKTVFTYEKGEEGLEKRLEELVAPFEGTPVYCSGSRLAPAAR